MDVLPVADGKVLESVVDVRLPRDLRVIDFVALSSGVDDRRELVCEEALGDEAAWVRSSVWVVEGIARHGLDIVAEVLDHLDRLAVVQIIDAKVVAHQLLVRSRLDEVSVVLVEVVHLIVKENGRWDVLLDLDLNNAVSIGAQRALGVVLLGNALDVLAHAVEREADDELDDTEDKEDDHGGAE